MNRSEEADQFEEEDEDDDDDTAELLRELDKIKKERAAERERHEKEIAEAEEAAKDQSIMTSNPLIGNQNFAVKRRCVDVLAWLIYEQMG